MIEDRILSRTVNGVVETIHVELRAPAGSLDGDGWQLMPRQTEPSVNSPMNRLIRGEISSFYTCNGSPRGCERERFGMCDWHEKQDEPAAP